MDGSAMPDDLISKMQDIEGVRAYLEKELGDDTLMNVYPILRDFGDDILFVEKTDILCKKVSKYLTKQQVEKYQNFFAILIFYELESQGQGSGGQEMNNKAGEFNAAATLKNLNMMTANFGMC